MAMDVDRRLRDAVPVDKARRQQVFEDVTRANIDPALLSVTQGNNYKPARAARRRQRRARSRRQASGRTVTRTSWR